MKLKTILSECWTGYKQVGMKNKGGKQVPNCVPESVNETISKNDIEKLTQSKDLDKFFKANKNKLDKKYIDDIEDQIGGLKYLESDYKRGDADWEEVLVAIEDVQDLIKKSLKIKETVKESSKDDIIKDLDKAKNDLLKKVDVLIAKKKKLYSNVDIETPMSADEKKLDKDIADLFSDINKLVLQKRSLKEAVSEGKYYVGYNKGRGQGTGVFKDSYSTYKDAKKEVEKLEKQRGGSYNMIAYYVADKDGKFVMESVNEETQMQTMIRKYADTKPESIYYVFYKGQFEATYAGTFGINTDYYWDKFKVRRVAGSKFKLNPEFIIVSKKTYDSNPNHYAKLKPYVDKFWDKLQNESVNEARNLKSIEKEFFAVSTEIQNTLADYKKHKGTDKEKGIVSKLKQLSDKKKKLEKEMDSAISGLYRDAELKVED